MSRPSRAYQLRVAGSAERQLSRLPEKAAAAVVEFMLGALLDNPAQLGGPLQRELAAFRSARRGAYRVVYAIDDTNAIVIVHRIDHRADAYRPR